MVIPNMKSKAKMRRNAGGSRIFKKRKFRGHQKVGVSSTKETSSSSSLNYHDCLQSASSRKFQSPTQIALPSSSASLADNDINNFTDTSSTFDNTLPSCNILIHSDILQSIISLLGTFPDCNNKSIEIQRDLSDKCGLSLRLEFVCTTTTCNWSTLFHTSKAIEKLPYQVQELHRSN